MTAPTSHDTETEGSARGSRVVAITGASAGVGRAVARKFAERGARIGLMARGHDGLEATLKDVISAGGEGLVLPLDVADAAAVDGAASRIEDEFGPIDVWVNNAMVTVFSPVSQMTPDEYRRVTEVTYLGGVHGTLAALHRMMPRDRGTIIQVGSALAYRPIPLQSAYCAAKHALLGFTDSLRTELLHDDRNIDLVTVHLPAVNTPQFTWNRTRLPKQPQPVPPIYQPELAANAIVYAADHPKRREIWLGYPTWLTILGDKFAPGLLDWYLAKNGYDSQQGEEMVDPDRPDNLWHPVPGDAGARGPFTDTAKDTSPAWFVERHRPSIAAAAGGLLAGAAAWWARRSR